MQTLATIERMKEKLGNKRLIASYISPFLSTIDSNIEIGKKEMESNVSVNWT